MRLTGIEARAAAASTRATPGWAGSRAGAGVQHNPDPHRPLLRGPVGYRFPYGGIGRVDRLDQGEPGRMSGMNLERIAGVVAVQGERRDKHGGIYAGRIHGRDHVVAGDLWRTRKISGPRPTRMIPLIGVDLSVNRQYVLHPSSTAAQNRRQAGFLNAVFGRFRPLDEGFRYRLPFAPGGWQLSGA